MMWRRAGGSVKLLELEGQILRLWEREEGEEEVAQKGWKKVKKGAEGRRVHGDMGSLSRGWSPPLRLFRVPAAARHPC